MASADTSNEGTVLYTPSQAAKPAQAQRPSPVTEAHTDYCFSRNRFSTKSLKQYSPHSGHLCESMKQPQLEGGCHGRSPRAVGEEAACELDLMSR